MPYDYKYLINYPTNLRELSLLNSTNRNEIKKLLKRMKAEIYLILIIGTII